MSAKRLFHLQFLDIAKIEDQIFWKNKILFVCLSILTQSFSRCQINQYCAISQSMCTLTPFDFVAAALFSCSFLLTMKTELKRWGRQSTLQRNAEKQTLKFFIFVFILYFQFLLRFYLLIKTSSNRHSSSFNQNRCFSI